MIAHLAPNTSWTLDPLQIAPTLVAAVLHDSVHALEHFCCFTGGIIVWLPVLETLPAPEWFGTGAKLGYIAVVRVVETILGNVFFWSGSVFYAVYAHQNRLWGVSA